MYPFRKALYAYWLLLIAFWGILLIEAFTNVYVKSGTYVCVIATMAVFLFNDLSLYFRNFGEKPSTSTRKKHIFWIFTSVVISVIITISYLAFF